jgi:hypothetical protein
MNKKLPYNEKYKTAISLKSDEQTYISKSEAFIAEMKVALTYMDKSADLLRTSHHQRQ